MRMWVLGLVLMSAPVGYGEAVCFPSISAAMARAGAVGSSGFRVEAVRRDAFSGATWAMVKSCAHPDWPAVSVISPHGMRAETSTPRRQVEVRPLVLAGARVRLVKLEERLRLEVVGVAQTSGALGERVRVRILATDAQAEERFAMGVVRSADLLEMEQ